MEKQIHGGNIYDKEVKLDFSVNINPLGMPTGVKEAIIQNVCEDETYPDIDCCKLREAIGEKEGVPCDWIVCGNGASELIMAVVRAVKPVKCALAAPSFSGYERAVRAYGAEAVYYNLDSNSDFGYKTVCEQLDKQQVQMCFICNPNNPTGNMIPENIMKDIITLCSRKNITLIVDECFLKFHPLYERRSCKNILKQYNNLIVINAFTKFYAMAGIRLGYMLCSDERLRRLTKEQLTEWNVSSVAQRAGIAALKDTAYESKTRILIETEREYLKKALSDMGCYVYPSEADYITFRLCGRYSGFPLQEELLKKKIWIRSCESYHNMPAACYRIAVKKHKDNESFIEEMTALCLRASGTKQLCAENVRGKQD